MAFDMLVLVCYIVHVQVVCFGSPLLFIIPSLHDCFAKIKPEKTKAKAKRMARKNRVNKVMAQDRYGTLLLLL